MHAQGASADSRGGLSISVSLATGEGVSGTRECTLSYSCHCRSMVHQNTHAPFHFTATAFRTRTYNGRFTLRHDSSVLPTAHTAAVLQLRCPTPGSPSLPFVPVASPQQPAIARKTARGRGKGAPPLLQTSCFPPSLSSSRYPTCSPVCCLFTQPKHVLASFLLVSSPLVLSLVFLSISRHRRPSPAALHPCSLTPQG